MIEKSTFKMPTGRNVLLLLAAMLIGSGLVRFGLGPGQAIAKEVVAATTEDPDFADLGSCQQDSETVAILDAILVRENQLEQRQRQVEEQEQSVAFAEQEIRRNLDTLRQAEESLASTMASVETAAENDLARLTAVYENMKPKDAAALFEQMAPEFAAGFVARMRPDAAAFIMTGLSPERAYSISVILAGRNANAPTQ